MWNLDDLGRAPLSEAAPLAEKAGLKTKTPMPRLGSGRGTGVPPGEVMQPRAATWAASRYAAIKT